MSEKINLDGASIDDVLAQLASPNRRQRQEAARIIAAVASLTPDQLVGHAEPLVEALENPEAQTRWEILDSLSALVALDAPSVMGATDAAEASLFDEDSAAARLSAFRFIARLGATAPDASDAAWPLLDEAIQCYHGDPEYRDMLGALLDFVRGDISDATRAALVERISFDAESGRGYVKAFSAEIVQAAQE